MLQESYVSQEQKTLSVFKRHLAAFFSGNLDAVVEDFGPQSVVVTKDGIFAGPDQIRHVFKALLAEFGTIDRGDSPGFTFDTQLLKGDTLFITWHAESMKNVFPFGTDTIICDGEKIIRQSIAFSPPRPR